MKLFFFLHLHHLSLGSKAPSSRFSHFFRPSLSISGPNCSNSWALFFFSSYIWAKQIAMAATAQELQDARTKMVETLLPGFSPGEQDIILTNVIADMVLIWTEDRTEANQDVIDLTEAIAKYSPAMPG